MKLSIQKKKIDEPARSEPPRRYRTSARFFWLVIIVWVVLFLMIRSAFHIGGSPVLSFLVMLVLLFVALACVRYGLVTFYRWWHYFKLWLARLLGMKR